MKIKVGVIGFGRMGRFYLEEFQKNGRYEVACICDIDAASRELAAQLSPNTKITAQEDDIFNDPSIQVVTLCTLANDRKAEAEKLLDDALAKDPNNFVALADKGMGLLNDNPAEAAKYLKRAFEQKSDNAVLATYTGTALSMQAQNTEDPAQKKALYTEAITYYDKAKELDPDRLQANWGYNRYNAYYNLYGEDDPKTKQAEADSK